MAGASLDLAVALREQRMVAELVVPPRCPADHVSEPLWLQLFRDANVRVTNELIEAVRAGIERHQAQPDEAVTVRALGKPAVHGEDERIDWKDGCDPQGPSAQADEGHRVDYYNKRSYVSVVAHQELGRVVPPTSGEDGMDATGQSIPARPGESLKLQLDESVMLDASGRLIAQQAGVLEYDQGKLRVRNCLHVAGFVDFSSGNVDFDGDVEVAKGVRDKFVVKATGTVTVHGLIEAATIETGKDLVARGGVAFKEAGHILAHGDLHARYLDNVSGTVEHHATVDREVINCQLVVVGNLDVERGSIIGGFVRVTGRARVGNLGSPACEQTTVVLGALPPSAAILIAAEQSLTRLESRYEKVDRKLKELQAAGALRSRTQREQLTELMCEQSDIAQHRDRLKGKCAQLRAIFDRQRSVELFVAHGIHPGVTVVVDGLSASFDQPIKGPLTIIQPPGTRDPIVELGHDKHRHKLRAMASRCGMMDVPLAAV